MDTLSSIFFVIALIVSVILHELAHGYAALSQGDETALRAGRLTFNPIKHLDIFGSILLPILLIVTSAPFLIGWAKPVPYNPLLLKNQRWGTLFVASAGIIVNFMLALIFAILFRSLGGALSDSTLSFMAILVVTNIVLGIFNLVPIPPLDGSKILMSFLPRRFWSVMERLESYSFFLVILFILFIWPALGGLIESVVRLFLGV